jgi:hypothetical protein
VSGHVPYCTRETIIGTGTQGGRHTGLPLHDVRPYAWGQTPSLPVRDAHLSTEDPGDLHLVHRSALGVDYRPPANLPALFRPAGIAKSRPLHLPAVRLRTVDEVDWGRLDWRIVGVEGWTTIAAKGRESRERGLAGEVRRRCRVQGKKGAWCNGYVRPAAPVWPMPWRKSLFLVDKNTLFSIDQNRWSQGFFRASILPQRGQRDKRGRGTMGWP